MIKDHSQDVLTTGQVAKICKVAPRTVAKWFDSGQLRGYRIPGSKDRRIPLTQLIRFMQAHGIPLEGLETGQTRVLIVDREPEFTTLLRDALQNEGRYLVDIAATPFEAGAIAQAAKPHVIVVDMSVPGLQAGQFCRFIRTYESLERTRLIATGADLTRGRGEGYVRDGFDAFLPKPFEVGQLIRTIGRVTADAE